MSIGLSCGPKIDSNWIATDDEGKWLSRRTLSVGGYMQLQPDGGGVWERTLFCQIMCNVGEGRKDVKGEEQIQVVSSLLTEMGKREKFHFA